MSDHSTPEVSPYKVLKDCDSMTIHHLYGMSTVDPGETLVQWFARQRFGFLADLKVHEFADEEIAAAVNGGDIEVAPWPAKGPSTEFFWIENEGADERLLHLADRAVELCYGQSTDELPGNDFAGVGAILGSQQLALAGLIYARVQGRLREMSELSGPAGPLYVVRGSFSAQLFELLSPEAPDAV